MQPTLRANGTNQTASKHDTMTFVHFPVCVLPSATLVKSSECPVTFRFLHACSSLRLCLRQRISETTGPCKYFWRAPTSTSFCSSVGATEHLGWASWVGRCRGGLGTCLQRDHATGVLTLRPTNKAQRRPTPQYLGEGECRV